MTVKERLKKIMRGCQRLFYKVRRLSWGHYFVILTCLGLSITVFYVLKSNCFKTIDVISTLTNLLTVNGVFSAILITYLFSRITWSKDRKLETYREAVTLSQKITDFRRILNELTSYYNVWNDDEAAKSLLDYGRFKNIDFYDYRLSMISDYKPKNYEIIKELYSNPNFREGQSTLYLAIVSLVTNRNNPNYEYHSELYKDFELDGLYNIKIVKKWIECGIFGTLCYWFEMESHCINFLALKSHKDYILSAAGRINQKYQSYELNSRLLKELADDFNSHYLSELYFKLKHLKKGIRDLNLLIIVLITVSMVFGVLAPFVLLLIQSQEIWFSIAVAILASTNAGLVAYFIVRFPKLINRELKWV